MTALQPSTTEAETVEAINRFSEALNARDIDAVMALMTEDCVFENTSPGPDGERFEGQQAVRAFWQTLAETPGMHFETEELVACGNRATARWRYSWNDERGALASIRGVDVFTVRDGKIAEKLSYVKG